MTRRDRLEQGWQRTASNKRDFSPRARRPPPVESSCENLLLETQGKNDSVVLTIVHDEAGTPQLGGGLEGPVGAERGSVTPAPCRLSRGPRLRQVVQSTVAWQRYFTTSAAMPTPLAAAVGRQTTDKSAAHPSP